MADERDEYENDIDQDLLDMSDEELEAAFKAAKADSRSPETDVEEDSDNETEEFDTEQPAEQDSDDNSEEVDGVEAEEEESKDEPTEEVKAEETEPQKAQKHKYKANGKEFEFTDEEIKAQFGKVFGQAMNYTQKMQAMAPFRGMIDTLKEQGVSQEDLNLMVDVLKGDKAAAAAMLRRTGIDALELEEDAGAKYQPKNYGRNETELAIQEIVEEIGNDPEYKVTYHVVEKEWDDKSRQVFAKNPALIKELHIDVKNGVFDKVSPMALKLKVLDGGRKSDIDYYIDAGKVYYAEVNEQRQYEEKAKATAAALDAEKQKVAQVKAQEAKRNEVKSVADKRKAAAPTSTRAGKQGNVDFLSDSDEDFEKWYKELQDK